MYEDQTQNYDLKFTKNISYLTRHTLPPATSFIAMRRLYHSYKYN